MQFTVGDRVRVSDDWFVKEIRGWIGIVSDPPNGVEDRRQASVYWVKFDSTVNILDPHPTTGAEIDGDALTLVMEGDCLDSVV